MGGEGGEVHNCQEILLVGGHSMAYFIPEYFPLSKLPLIEAVGALAIDRRQVTKWYFALRQPRKPLIES